MTKNPELPARGFRVICLFEAKWKDISEFGGFLPSPLGRGDREAVGEVESMMDSILSNQQSGGLLTTENPAGWFCSVVP